MFVRPKNLILAVCNVCLLLLIGALPMFAQITFNDFSNVNNLALNGTSAQSTNVLRITPALGNQVGSVWYVTKQPLTNGFSTSFQFQFTNPSNPSRWHRVRYTECRNWRYRSAAQRWSACYGGDDNNQNPALGIPSSLAIEFDSFQNQWTLRRSMATPAMWVQSCGTGNNTSHHGQICPLTGLSSTLGNPIPAANLADGTFIR
jgi:hypothetical protein